jgi:hypothetical protein
MTNENLNNQQKTASETKPEAAKVAPGAGQPAADAAKKPVEAPPAKS